MANSILYKYRSCDSRSISMLENRELYFSDPKHFNDPVDCKINIFSALKAAVELAENEDSTVRNKLEQLGKLDDLFKKIENGVKNAGVYSLTREQNNVLMWSHYADKHKGFSVGFDFSSSITEYNEENQIVGTEDVYYSEDNPFVEYFLSICKAPKLPPWEEFWPSIFSMGLVAKSYAWKYENEVRVIRGNAGIVTYSPDDLKEMIFGLEIETKKRNDIENILSGSEFTHVQMKKIVREYDGFKLRIENC